MPEREKIEEAFEAIRHATEAGDWNAFVDLFAEEGTFVNSMLPAPIEGREAIRAFAERWPKVVNRPEWVVTEGSRLVVGWNERQEAMAPEAEPYRGISTFVFDSEGRVSEYEGIFDTAAVVAAMRGAANAGEEV